MQPLPCAKRARRDNLRRTWVPTGKALQALEDEKGVVIRFLIGYRRGPRLRALAAGPARVPGAPVAVRLQRRRVKAVLSVLMAGAGKRIYE